MTDPNADGGGTSGGPTTNTLPEIDRRTAIKGTMLGIAGLTLFPGTIGGKISANLRQDPVAGVTLYAAQNIDVGTVSVEFDSDDELLAVTYDTSKTSSGENSEWEVVATHLHVADEFDAIPTDRNDNPVPGQFDHTGKPDEPSETITYEEIDIGDFDHPAFVAAHAEVRKNDDEETAWAHGDRFTERGSWATYLEVDLLAGREAEDPANRLYGTSIVDAKPGNVVERDLENPTEMDPDFEDELNEDPDEWEPEKIHPVVQEWIEERDPNHTVELVLNFQDETTLPRFPEPATNEPRDSVANQRVLERTEELIEELQDEREEYFEEGSIEFPSLVDQLEEKYEAEHVDTFWLVKAIAVEMPIGRVDDLVEEEDELLYVDPEETGAVPPRSTEGESVFSRYVDALSNGTPTVADGRDHIVSDPYFRLGLSGGWIGLLDTGVDNGHTLFNDPSNLAFWRDCVNGTEDYCTTGDDLNPDDTRWNHGTKTAGVIMGNDNLGSDYRGVTEITLDSFDVYGDGGLKTKATVRGFEAALAVLDRVIVAEMQGGGNPNNAIATAADNAFDAGALTIAANGNKGPDAETVRTPANARKAIGIGALEANNDMAQYDSQSRGPTDDNRIKPDVQAPTNTETASNTGNEALTTYGGTSGATPYGAGAAGLLRNWLRKHSSITDPGQVYSHLILSGSEAESFDNTSGAGLLGLPTNGWAWWGKVGFPTGRAKQVEVTLDVSLGASELAGAIWWPKGNLNVVFLQLIDPSGTVQSKGYLTSASLLSVFQRVEVQDPTPGEWTLRIGKFLSPSQTVYFSAHRRD